MSAERRRPVPREWREDNHVLTMHTRQWGRGFRRVSRAKGRCSCGITWPAGKYVDNMTPTDVREAYNDHVEEAYYAQRGEQGT